MVMLDFGTDFSAPEKSVTAIIGDLLPYSALVGGLAATLAVTLGITIGLIAANRVNTWFDHGVTIFSVAFGIIPSLVLGFILVYLFISATGPTCSFFPPP